MIWGFAYIVLTTALKESGWIRTKGIIFAAAIKLLSLIIFVVVLVNGSGLYKMCGMKHGNMKMPCSHKCAECFKK
jgi:hypothetical protein